MSEPKILYVLFKSTPNTEPFLYHAFYSKKEVVSFCKRKGFYWDKENNVFSEGVKFKTIITVMSIVPGGSGSVEQKVDFTKEWEESLEDILHDFFTVEQDLFKKATEAPWRLNDNYGLCIVGPDKSILADFSPERYDPPWRGKREDANFIVRARTGWPLALKVLSDILDTCEPLEEGGYSANTALDVIDIIETAYKRFSDR